ncbi:MAG: sigma-70 family RNA polymerase sigma factor [Oscillospiraceae bacterium]|nr:sigma-70 family RNA polymerase sigma factor [Oscillospiraceae bacterium]
MQEINLREYYPFSEDNTIEVSEEILEVLQEDKRRERNHTERVRWNKAYYSLHLDDGVIEYEALFFSPSSEEIILRRQSEEVLYATLGSLPEKQRRRVYAHYILGIPQVEIARIEGVAEAVVCIAIQRGLRNMKKTFDFVP